jgi:hypothetical protein
MAYKCPVCIKVSGTALDLSRHMIGRGDKEHRDWLASKGFKYSELLRMQLSAFGGEGYRTISEVIERECKMKE